MLDLPRASGAVGGGPGGASMRSRRAIAGALLLCAISPGCKSTTHIGADGYKPPQPVPTAAPLFPQRHYEAPWMSIAPAIDGNMDAAWDAAPWSDDFVDIEGPTHPTPRFKTRVKMAWDASNLYILADLEEPDLWATLRTHDEIVFQDNDFEVFIDPDGDTREYYEIEVNALGTIFDLFLPLPYRAEGKADHGWTAQGMRLAITMDGTLNNSSDRDRGWRVEMALPWTMFEPVATPMGTHQSASRPPLAGDEWRINFSRVQWALEKRGQDYAKVPGRAEDNWTWTPQWMVDMHVPQWWGIVRFNKNGETN